MAYDVEAMVEAADRNIEKVFYPVVPPHKKTALEKELNLLGEFGIYPTGEADGICVICGRPISAERIASTQIGKDGYTPYLCVECQTLLESGERPN